MSDKKPSLKRSIIGGGVSIILLAAAGFLLLNQQFVKDQISVWSFTPSSGIQAIDQRIGLTGKGKFYFYATQPQIDGSDQFNADCPRQEVGNPILGCYAAGRIYVYDVANVELDGIEEVTASHEMLHAVWERMSPSEQVRIGTLLRTEYQKLKSDTDLTERMEYYQRTEPGQFENELHSILGTERGNLSPELESYYGQYFTDRQKVVDLHAKYDAVFTGLKKQSDSLYEELSTLGKSIETRTVQYNADIKQLSADIAAFNSRADSGSFSSISQFNSERSALIARSNQLDTDRDAIGNDITKYNGDYAEYQKVSTQIEALNKSIDSIKDLQPTPSV